MHRRYLLLALLLVAACSSSPAGKPDPTDTTDVQAEEVGSVDVEEDLWWPVDVADAGEVEGGEVSPDTDTGSPDVVDSGAELPDAHPDTAETTDGGADSLDIAPDVPPCDLDSPCDDGDPCTLDDTCTPDGCLGTPMDCADELACTFDTCVDGACTNDLKPGWCYIAGACRAEGEANPNNPCLECITAHKVYTWSADDTNACDDENACSQDDRCADGSCMGDPLDCDDDNPCTADSCEFGQCVHLPLNLVSCEDGDLCTLDDLCVGGECQPGETLRECDDFNTCTQDLCDPAQGCIYPATDGAACEDGNLCTQGDTCLATQCVPGNAVTCDDSNACTTDSCSPFIGCKYVNNALPCDDGNPCTLGDQCLGGVCKKGLDSLDCDDENSCTMQWCSPLSGCQYAPIVAQCNDGDACTVGDHCAEGACVPAWTVACDDGNPCTDDVCDENFGCAHPYNSNPCDDGNACTLLDQCVKGACKSGAQILKCFEENPCASGSCDPAVGCVMQYENDMPCDDGDVCTVNDYCLDGACHPGSSESVDCSDGNDCTADWCDPQAGCLHENIESPCDDGNLCTGDDQCVEGQCLGVPVTCDDSNACTLDSCVKDQGCKHSVVVSAWCQPQIVIEYPPRAAELTGPPFAVEVVGHVVHNAAPVAWVTLNGDKVAVQADDTFTYTLNPVQGLNIIQAEVYDEFDGHDKVIQTFLMSTHYTPMNAGNPKVSMIDDGVMIFLGQNVWDDNEPDPNDFATFFTYLFNSIDIAGMIPNPLYENGEYKIKAKNLSHGPFSLNITCIKGGLHMVATLPNLHIKLDADSKKWYLPDASGDVDASKLVVAMDVMLTVDNAGNVSATLKNVSADVHNLDVDLDGALGFLLNWLVDFFEGTFASTLEDQVEDAITDALPPALEGALEDLAFDTEFEVPPLFGDAQPVTLSMKSRVSTLDFTPTGGVVGLSAAVVTPKGVDMSSKGTLARGGCLGNEAPFAFWMLDEIEMSVYDDFLNQIPYAMWWAGLLDIPLDPETLGGGSFEEYGIEDLSLTARALLPPVLTDCASNEMQIQMGDLEIDASLNMFGMDVDVLMYATFTASVVIGVAQGEDGQNMLSMAVTDVNDVLLEVATVSENLIGSEDTLRLLIKDQVMPVFLEQITGDSLASFPLPEMDMSGMIPGLPGEAKLEMTPKSSYRVGGYTVITGSVHE